MASWFLKMCLFFTMLFHFLFFISPSFSSSTHPKSNDIFLSSTASPSRLQGENLIRGLNIFPSNSINIRENDPHVLHGNIAEKKFTFPGFDVSGYHVEELGHHAGYYSLPHSKAARMFYFFFESRNTKDDPVVIWLTGDLGPGCSSEIAMFYENGPFQFSKDKNLSLVWNEYGWDKASNIIFVDQPIGTGFSYTTDGSNYREDEDGISNDLYDFLQYYDIRKKCQIGQCVDFSDMEKFLNMKTVKEALGVGDLQFRPCNTTVYIAMLEDWMKNLDVGIPALLEDGIKLLVYAGEKDLICNWLGNSRWVDAMEWSGQTTFKESPTTPFLVDGEEAGILKSHGPLAFLKVKEAGHMVPMDQPKVALQMLKDWMQGKLI